MCLLHIITQRNVDSCSTLLQVSKESLLFNHVTICSTVNVPYVAPCGACHASYQAKLLIEVLAELIHLCRSNHLSVTLLLPVWALGGKVSLPVEVKTLDL